MQSERQVCKTTLIRWKRATVNPSSYPASDTVVTGFYIKTKMMPLKHGKYQQNKNLTLEEIKRDTDVAEFKRGVKSGANDEVYNRFDLNNNQFTDVELKASNWKVVRRFSWECEKLIKENIRLKKFLKTTIETATKKLGKELSEIKEIDDIEHVWLW